MMKNKKIKPILELERYNQKGYYSYFLESIEKMKKLLSIISASVLFKPNISNLSEKI